MSFLAHASLTPFQPDRRRKDAAVGQITSSAQVDKGSRAKQSCAAAV